MTRHDAIRAIFKKEPSLADGHHDAEVMDRLREVWSPQGPETSNTYDPEHAAWARGTLDILKCIQESLPRLPATERRHIQRQIRSAKREADDGNRTRLKALREEVVRLGSGDS